MQSPPKKWRCLCVVVGVDVAVPDVVAAIEKEQPGYLTRCPDCGAPRPPS